MIQKEFEKLTYQEKIKHNLPAIIAVAHGEEIECKLSDDRGYTGRCDLGLVHHYPYRVKPKTVNKWVNIYLKSDPTLVQGFVYFSKEIADKNCYDNRVACVEIEVPVAT